MTAQILDGVALANQMQTEAANGVQLLLQQGLLAPTLAVVLVGNDPASQLYVKHKRQACANVGIISRAVDLPENTSETELLQIISALNADTTVHGILVQLPLPQHINSNKIIAAVDPNKDVDGLHPYNLGWLTLGEPVFHSCTAHGIMTLLRHYLDLEFKGVAATIISHSILVGKPLALELLNVNATVNVCHAFTKNLKTYVENADLLIAAAGVAEMVKGDWIKPGAIVVDVGTNHLPDGKLVGDIEFIAAKEQASWITPVPGGVGPMTVAALMQNTLRAAKRATATRAPARGATDI
ncbi:MAG: bifunctional methylenetetrahydrofolate dehydrogenase/methenyltetrahydrofolate cyclohydrolase FolD [Gammaproteobacteria bacterium]|nr:bifunctional methylenetetrahydrofolate dehydrogenase/methenyltetrahydrofolate cyclohydrolase FolD [Gammaproteobacteria bacterium]